MRTSVKRSVADGRRGSPKRKVKESWLRPLCNPLVLKTVYASVRLLYELVKLWRH
jgi:hypothetical protein